MTTTMPQLKIERRVVAREGAEISDLPPQRLTTRMCDFHECQNYEKLNKCSRCRSAMYCSKNCQKADWAQHKAICQLSVDFPRPVDPETGREPPLNRHLRLWTARFEGSLLCAVIPALELNKHPENIDKFGLVVVLQPRPHPEPGARFALRSATVMPMDGIVEIMGVERVKAQGASVMQLHRERRAALRESSAGDEDYATVVVIATNTGPHKLPGPSAAEIRFKPVNIYGEMVRSPQLIDPELDWHLDLSVQIDHDLPNQTIVP
ncbi:hypothetical protein B0H15DRAFT_862808 [Mycena belliarum]|uniref:MYND-type domain-containing protein n=1 Tax=Mycena belliarum TaxID=1033014 RepID=A0AAD6TRK9_9AGAR|nr:hypothetical protein B0H15DRAFT_862808 [Mycena belliae]